MSKHESTPPRAASHETPAELVVDGPRPAVALVAAIPRTYRVSPGDRLILTMLACDSFDGETSAPTTGNLAHWAGMFPSSVWAALTRLSEATDHRPALVAREESTRGRNRTVWRLLLEPSDSPGEIQPSDEPSGQPSDEPSGIVEQPPSLPFPPLKADPSGLGGAKPDKSGDSPNIGYAVSSPEQTEHLASDESAPTRPTGDLPSTKRGASRGVPRRASRAQVLWIRDLRAMTGTGLQNPDPLTVEDADHEIRDLWPEIERRRHNREPLDGNYWDLSPRARAYVDEHDLDIDRREAS